MNGEQTRLLSAGLFDKVVSKYVVACLAYMNTKDFGLFFSALKAATVKGEKMAGGEPPLNCSLVATRHGLGTLPLDALLDSAGNGAAARQQIMGHARAGENLVGAGGGVAARGCMGSHASSFYFALYCTALHCHREGKFVRSFFSTSSEWDGAPMSEDDESESEHLMTEVYADYGGRLLLPELLKAVSDAAASSDALQLLAMYAVTYDVSDRSLPPPGSVRPASLLARASDKAGANAGAGTPGVSGAALGGGGLFVHNLFSDVNAHIVSSFASWVKAQVAGLATFAKKADPKKCGIIPPIIHFVPLVLRAEALLAALKEPPEGGSVRKDRILRRNRSGFGVYTELADAIDGCLETVANSNPKYTFLVLFQNYGYFATCLEAVAHIPELSDHVGMARHCFEANLAAYAEGVLTSAPFHDCAAYFERVLASKIELEEVQFQSVFSKPNLRKVLKPMTRKAVVTAIGEIARKIRRQLATPPPTTAGLGSDGDGAGANAAFSVEAVWGRVSRTLCSQWAEWERLCDACYGAEESLVLSADEVAELMEAEAQAMVKAAASAAAMASTAHTAASARGAAAKWRAYSESDAGSDAGSDAVPHVGESLRRSSVASSLSRSSVTSAASSARMDV